jgi:hypothetical protein
MRWKKINEHYATTRNVGQKGGFKFSYAFIDEWFVVVSHLKKDIRLNTLWIGLKFKEETDVIDWCENFDYKNFKCLGSDS